MATQTKHLPEPKLEGGDIRIAPKIDKLSPEDRLRLLIDEHRSISGVIRYLASKGAERAPIARYIGKPYQHVHNVLKTPLKKH